MDKKIKAREIILAIAVLALSALASCRKDNFVNTGVEPAGNVRIITGTFSGDGTKTTLDTDGITPLWSEGDVIRLLDGSGYEDITLTSGCIDSEDPTKISFTTTLPGPMLYAVYPASATSMSSCTDGNVSFTIPSIQDGTFSSANICVASGDGADNIYFSNATAVVEMNVAGGVIGTNFAATNSITGDMTVAMGSKGAIGSTSITSYPASPTSPSKSIFVSGEPSDGKYYIAVAPIETGDVTITCSTSSKYGSAAKTSKTLEIDHIYAMDLSSMTIGTEDLTGETGTLGGQDYVLIRAFYDSTNPSYLKWSTQNLAVTDSGKGKWNGTGYLIGDYFQWAASYDGYGITAEADKNPLNLVIYEHFTNTFTTSGCSFDDGLWWLHDRNGFDLSEKHPYYAGGYDKYNATDRKPALELSDDVAHIVLGDSWRMPTGGRAGEFKAMREATYWAWDATDKGYYVFKPGDGTTGFAGGFGPIGSGEDKTKALLFFPAAGKGEGCDLVKSGENGFYWSSSIDHSFVSDASDRLFFAASDGTYDNIVTQDGDTRFSGFSVRPVSE